MSGAENQASVLSREELSGLLESLSSEATRESQSLRTKGLVDPGAGRTELTGVAARFAEEQARSLSTLHQTPIHLRFSHWEEITLRKFASAMLPTDRIACLDLGRGGADVYLLLSRPFIFGWMMLAFGAQPGSGNNLVPSRTYTRIEERFLQRAATEVAQTFAKALGGDLADGRFVAIANPVSLYDRAKRPYVVASFEVDGLGDLCGMRLALPNTLLDDAAEPPSLPAESSGMMAEQLLDMPLQLRVQIGFKDASLGEVATLKVGEELLLQQAADNGLVVHVEDVPKYRAEPGNIGGKLAIRITDVLDP